MPIRTRHLRKPVIVATAVTLAAGLITIATGPPADAGGIMVTANKTTVTLAKAGASQKVTLTLTDPSGQHITNYPELTWTNSSSNRKVATCTRRFNVLTITAKGDGAALGKATVSDGTNSGGIEITVHVGPKSAWAAGPAPSSSGGAGGGLVPVKTDPFPKTVAMSGKAYPANRNNPLRGGRWGLNNGKNSLDESYITAHFNRSKGGTKTNLGRIGRQPYVTWFTGVNANAGKLDSYITSVQNGNKNTLVQVALFGIYSVNGTNKVGGASVGGEANTTALSKAERTKYRNWTKSASRAIGNRRVAVILEPDAAMLANRPSMRSKYKDAATRRGLVKWAAKYLHQHNKKAVVYLDAGDADWLRPVDAVTHLRQVGVQYARGFALGATHYSSATGNVTYAKKVADGLAAKGVKGKKAVLDTSDNGHPYTWGQWTARFGAKGFDNSRICTSKSMKLCSSLGIRPTWKTGARSLNKLPVSAQPKAKKYVDGYLWFGRPWLTNQAHPFNLDKAVSAAKYSPYF